MIWYVAGVALLGGFLLGLSMDSSITIINIVRVLQLRGETSTLELKQCGVSNDILDIHREVDRLEAFGIVKTRLVESEPGGVRRGAPIRYVALSFPERREP